MKRRSFIIQSMAASTSLMLSPYLLSGCRSGIEGRKLTILHTNDMHSHIEAFDEGRYEGRGGMAARASAIQQVRREVDQLLLLDVGDVFQGTPYFNMFGGELELKLMSTMGYDATTVGNHEFDNGLNGLKYAMQFANFPHLIANYDFSRNQLAGLTKPYQVFDKGGLKIGVFGLGIRLEGLVSAAMYGNTIYQDPIPVAREMVQELKAKDCDLIVCLSHLGYQYDNPGRPSDKLLAQEVSEIDIILGGHTHTFMEKPFMLTNSDGFTSTINQVGWAGLNLGRIDIEFSGSANSMTAHSPIQLVDKRWS